MYIADFPFRPIAETNMGHKMLKKMGWTEGESLGKDNEGIQQPVRCHYQELFCKLLQSVILSNKNLLH